MRIKHTKPTFGERRVRRGFVLWKRIWDETRIFEFTAWIEEYNFIYGWHTVGWVEK